MKFIPYMLCFCLGAGLNGCAQKRSWAPSPCAPRAMTEEWVIATGKQKEHPVTRRTMLQVEKIKQATVEAEAGNTGGTVNLPGAALGIKDGGHNSFSTWLENRGKSK